MILKNLFRRKTRSALTIVGIAIGVAAVVALGAMAEGIINSYSKLLTSSGADLILSQSDAADLLLSAVDEDIGPKAAAIAGVDQVAGLIVSAVTTPQLPYFLVFGLDPSEFAIRHFKITEGQPLRGPRQMLLGKAAASNLKKRVGDTLKVYNVAYRIVGIYETGAGFEEGGGVISLKEAQEIFKKPRQVTFYQVKTKRADRTAAVQRELERRFPRLTASRSADYAEQQQEMQLFRAFGWFIGFLAVLVGGLGMMNTMLMSVFERTREIGVLRAVGWRRGRVLRLILVESFALSILGGLTGIALGIVLTQAVSQVPAVGTLVQGSYSPGLFVQAMAVALVLGALGGLYPAWRAGRLEPVEAMRYEGGTATASYDRLSRWRWLLANPLSPLLQPMVSMSLRNLLRQRTRTLLTLLGIGLGVGLVVALSAMADGFVVQFTAMSTSSGDLTAMEAKASDLSLSAIDEKVGRWMAALPAVEHVSGMILGVATMPGTPYFLVMGLDPGGYAIRHFTITQGDRLRGPREIIVGKVAAKNLKKQVGDTLKILGSTYRIVGIYETGTGYEDGGGVISLKEAQNVFRRPNQVSFYGIKLRQGTNAEETRQQIQGRWPQVAVSRSSEFAEKTNDIQTTRTIVNALSFIAILVGGVAMTNAMLMAVFERTREIGTLRALGWRRRRVLLMILRESLLLSFLGGLAGIALGVGLNWLVTLAPAVGEWLAGSYSLRLFGQALGIALVLGTLGGLYPAWRAANLSPIEALRYE